MVAETKNAPDPRGAPRPFERRPDYFVWVDWDRKLTRLVLYDRQGWGVFPKSVVTLPNMNAQEVVRAVADLCERYSCPPMVDISGAGAAILEAVQARLGMRGNG